MTGESKFRGVIDDYDTGSIIATRVYRIRSGAMFGPGDRIPLGNTVPPGPKSLGNTVRLKYCTSREYSPGEEADSIP